MSKWSATVVHFRSNSTHRRWDVVGCDAISCWFAPKWKLIFAYGKRTKWKFNWACASPANGVCAMFTSTWSASVVAAISAVSPKIKKLGNYAIIVSIVMGALLCARRFLVAECVQSYRRKHKSFPSQSVINKWKANVGDECHNCGTHEEWEAGRQTIRESFWMGSPFFRTIVCHCTTQNSGCSLCEVSCLSWAHCGRTSIFGTHLSDRVSIKLI